MIRLKRPKKITEWFKIEAVPSEWKDWNNKPTVEYVIKLPYWLARAYKRGNLHYAQVSLHDEAFSMKDMERRSTHKLFHKYFKENWCSKVSKMRKINNNYMQMRTVKQCSHALFHGIQCYEMESKYGFFNSKADVRPSHATWIKKEDAEKLFQLFRGD